MNTQKNKPPIEAVDSNTKVRLDGEYVEITPSWRTYTGTQLLTLDYDFLIMKLAGKVAAYSVDKVVAFVAKDRERRSKEYTCVLFRIVR